MRGLGTSGGTDIPVQENDMAEPASPPHDGRPDESTDPGLSFVPSPKRVRVRYGGETVADSTRVMLLREPGHVPVYYFPRADVRIDLMARTARKSHCPRKGSCSYFTLSAGGRTTQDAAWSYEAPLAALAPITNSIAFYWDHMDQWLEEDEEVFRHPRDPFRRVDVCASHREVRVVLAGQEVARTTDARFLFETGHPTRYYLPRPDVRMDWLVPSATRTTCPYKGNAVYFHALIGDRRVEDVAWSYPEPVPECARIAGLLCFFNERVDDVLIDGAAVPAVRTRWSPR
jgi:uncharacterized protein (DUF427 family)